MGHYYRRACDFGSYHFTYKCCQSLAICRLTSRRSQPPLALLVPLSRFTSRVGGGSAFYVRRLHHITRKDKINEHIRTRQALTRSKQLASLLHLLLPTRSAHHCSQADSWSRLDAEFRPPACSAIHSFPDSSRVWHFRSCHRVTSCRRC